MDTTNLFAYLPFDESATQDLCGNTWTVKGSLTVQDGALNLESSSTRNYIYTTPPELGTQDFTIDWWEDIPASRDSFTSEVIVIDGTTGSATRCLDICYYSSSTPRLYLGNGSWRIDNVSIGTKLRDQWVHRAVVRSGNTISAFENGTLYTSATFNYSLNVAGSSLFIGNFARANMQFVGKLKNVRIHVGSALWTEDFTPPTENDYEQLKREIGEPFSLEANMERIITNAVWKPSMNLKAWLPFNRTPAEDLCGNEWTLNGDATIEETGAINGNALQVTHAYIDTQYGWLGMSTPRLSMNGGITLGGQSFTIKICANFSVFPNKWNGGYGEIFVLSPTAGGILNDLHSNPSTIFLSVSSNGYLYSGCLGVVDSIIKLELNQTYAFEYVYSHSDGKVFIFLDGQKVNTIDVIIPETVFPNVLIDYAHWSANHPTAAIDEFRIYDGAALHTENFTPPTAENYIQQMLEQEGQAAFGYSLNTERVLTNNRKPINPYIAFSGANGCYGEVPLETLAGKSTFTIEAKFSTTTTASSSNSWECDTIFGREIGGRWQDDFGLYINGGKLGFWAEPKLGGSSKKSDTITEAVVNDGAIHKIAVVAFDGAIDLYCDGEKIAHTDNVNAKISDAYSILLASNSNFYSYLKMNFYEARLWSVVKMPEQIFADIQGNEKGLEAWYIPSYRTDIIPDLSGHERHVTLYGSPVVSFEYEQNFDYAADVEFLIFNAANEFKYSEEIGTGLTFLESLDLAMSKTGTAFYQTTLERCFNLPPLPEIWIEFDVYFDGTHRWRAFNGGTNGTCGITAQTSKQLSFFSNGNNVGNFDNVCPANQLRTMRLHMKTGAIDGVIEAWVDGHFINKYIGDVNHGELFEDLYLQSDGMDTCFSNFRISNVGFSDSRYLMLDFNLERKVKNATFVWSDKADSENSEMKLVAQGEMKTMDKATPALVQGEIIRCFDLPPTYEIWIDFDVYFDGENIWRAGNVSPTYGICGITSATTGILNYLSNGEEVKAFPNLCKVNIIQTVLLHMISGINDGIIEAWLNGKHVYQYVGDVNYGEDFCDIFLQCEGTGGTVFSNITFSNVRLDPRIYLCARHDGENLFLPLRYSKTPETLAFAVRYDGKNWYNLLREPSYERAGAVRIWHDNAEYALAKG